MARYKDEAKEQIRDAVDFAAIVGARIDLQRSGVNQLKGLCPFHDERSPSFGINPVDKVYYCFGCGEGGDVFDYVMKTEGLDFVSALEYLADRTGVTLEVQDEDPQEAARRKERDRLYDLIERTTQYYERYLWESQEAASARAYLEGRGLREEVLRTYRVGYAPSAWDKVLLITRRAGFTTEEMHAAGLAIRSRDKPGSFYDRFRRRIMFPLADSRGRVVGFGARAMSPDEKAKYLNSPEGNLFHKSKLLYGAHLARHAAAKAGAVIVTEGYTDVIALHQAGLANAVCIMGTSLTEDQVGELVRMAPRSVLALDADNAGQEAMLRAAKVAEGRKLELRVATLPPGRDPAELVAQDGPDAVADLVSSSVPFVRFRVERVLDRGDITDAEGKDRVIAEIRPILSAMAPSVLREDLAQHVADRLALSPTLAALLVQRDPHARPDPAQAPAPDAAAQPAPAARNGAPAGARSSERTDPFERTFLTLCIALPTQGEALIAQLDPDEHLVSPLMRRVARHLKGHLRAPTEGLPVDDPELVAQIQQLTVRAGQAQSSPAALHADWLQLELGRLDRAVKRATREGAGEVGELAKQRGAVQAELQDALGY